MKKSILALAMVASFASLAVAAEESTETQAPAVEEQKAEAAAEVASAEASK